MQMQIKKIKKIKKTTEKTQKKNNKTKQKTKTDNITQCTSFEWYSPDSLTNLN